VNTVRDAPSSVEGDEFRREHGLADDEVAFVVVSRLIAWLKLEGIRRAMAAVDELATTRKLRLLVVGEGTAQEDLGRRAAEINGRHTRDVVTMVGPMLDPRPAYAAADVVLGMGGSALRAMAFGKPVIVLGEGGFSESLRPDTTDRFFDAGYYGFGPASTSLVEQMRAIADDPQARQELGRWGRGVVETRYDLRVAAQRLNEFLGAAASDRPSRFVVLADGLRAAARRNATAALPPWLKEPLARFPRPHTATPEFAPLDASATSRVGP
jgi:glycosyltransferase involved in cell wall biosynthesis